MAHKVIHYKHVSCFKGEGYNKIIYKNQHGNATTAAKTVNK